MKKKKIEKGREKRDHEGKSKTSDFKMLLRKSGYKATPSRLLVLEVLQKARGPISAQRFIEMLKGQMNQVTVYRILKALKTKGLIRPIDLRHNHAHYELVKGNDHHHLVCVGCGRIEDVHDCGVENNHRLVLRHAKHFASVEHHALEFYGMCKVCAKKKP